MGKMDRQRIKRIVGYLFSKRFWLAQIVKKQSLCSYLPDKFYLELWYYVNTGNKLNLKAPHTFREKIQWLKLYDRNPQYTIMVDKYAVKRYVADIIGEEYIIPTIRVWKRPDDIDFESLPNKFVLKCNHDSGGLIICKDKSKLDKESVIKKLNRSLKLDFYKLGREWPYKNVPRCIIAEQYIEPVSNIKDLPDYKFFCFNGEPKCCQVITGRESEMCVDFFDREWNHLPFKEPLKYKYSEKSLIKPENYEQMWILAEKLSDNIPFVRVDLYNLSGKILFGELTFFPTSGIGDFDPPIWDEYFGSWIDLPDC